MTDLHAAIAATLDREQAGHTQGFTDGPDYCRECSRAIENWVRWPCLPSRRVEADRRVLARHDADRDMWCDWCTASPMPCPDIRDLAARYDVETSR